VIRTDRNLPVTVVIPARNAAATLQRQLKALHNQRGGQPFEVIVVDNGSTDATAAVAASGGGDHFRVRVVSEGRAGVNRARNAGVAAAVAGVVLLCDADDEVHDGWVAALSAAVDDRHWAGGSVDYEALNSSRTRSLWGAPARAVPSIGEPYVDRTVGCSCGFTTSMWQELGGFEDQLSGAGDENEFFMRAHAAGFRLRPAPDAVVSYTLRPGRRAFIRQRYRSGRGHAMAARFPGGHYLLPTVQPRQAVVLTIKLLMSAPKYCLSSESRWTWVGAVGRQTGRHVGWWQGRHLSAES
jgi:glycosyltransferase involved in cell wall biosynthesis